jgi:hypothetical protein
MIFDADTHLSPRQEGNNSIGIEKLVELMDHSGVDKCLSWVYPPYIKTNLNSAVDYVAEAMKKYPDKIYGFGWIDPNLGMENALELTKRCMEEYGFYGVKLNGSQNKYYVDDPEKTYPIIEEVKKAGGVVAFHTGSDDVDHVHPYRVKNVIKDFPDMNFLMIHMGGAVSKAAIEVAQEYSNVTLVGSEVAKPAVLNAIRILGTTRVAFGSDTPFCIMSAETAAYQAMLKEEGLSLAEIEDVMYGNIARILKVI